MFIFDEPTTGLHFHDIRKLLKSFNALMSKGHTIVIVEHNMDVIKSADWVIDLGPEAGDRGGYLVFEGTPAQLKDCKESYTGKFLALNTDRKTGSAVASKMPTASGPTTEIPADNRANTTENTGRTRSKRNKPQTAETKYPSQKTVKTTKSEA